MPFRIIESFAMRISLEGRFDFSCVPWSTKSFKRKNKFSAPFRRGGRRSRHRKIRTGSKGATPAAPKSSGKFAYREMII
jgi:hypothetical protein